MDEQKNLLNADAFLGRGWSFPPELTDSGIKMSAYEQDIEEIVFRIRGEYPMSAEYDPAFIAIFYKVDPDWRYNIW